MLRDLDGNSGHEQPIDVVRVPHASWVSVLGGIDNHSNWKVALSECAGGRICNGRIGDAEHVNVKFDFLSINGSLGASSIIVLRHACGKKVHFAVNRICRIRARQSNAGSVCVVSEVYRVSPPIVVFGAETVDHICVIGKVDGLICVIYIRSVGPELAGGKIGTAKFNHALAREQHHLPVQNAVCDPLPHGKAVRGGCECGKNLRICRMPFVSSGIYQHTYCNASLLSSNQRIGDGGVIHEPEGGIDFLIFILDELQQWRTTIFKRHIAKPFCRRCGRD